jgi:hypothetical protein
MTVAPWPQTGTARPDCELIVIKPLRYTDRADRIGHYLGSSQLDG